MNELLRALRVSSPVERDNPNGIVKSLICLGITEGVSQALHEANGIRNALEMLHAAGSMDERIVIGELIAKVNEAIMVLTERRNERISRAASHDVEDVNIVS